MAYMIRKPKVIKGDLILFRVKASRNSSLGENQFCYRCKYLTDNRCILDIVNSEYNKRAYDFCIYITPSPLSRRSRPYKFVYIYVEEKEIL